MNSYVAYIIEQLSVGGKVYSRSMFGGYGIYKDDIIIGIIVNNELYFKTNKDTEKDYQKLGSEPFTYNKNGKCITMSYWKVPEEIIEDSERLNNYSLSSYQISCNSKKK